jgi:hypothetical protein
MALGSDDDRKIHLKPPRKTPQRKKTMIRLEFLDYLNRLRRIYRSRAARFLAMATGPHRNFAEQV